jgi:hypothetical protein
MTATSFENYLKDHQVISENQGYIRLSHSRRPLAMSIKTKVINFKWAGIKVMCKY